MNSDSQQEVHLEDFGMLLNEVLQDLANPTPTDLLKGKVMMRLQMVEEEAAVEIPRLKIETWGTRPVLAFERIVPQRSFRSMAAAFGVHAAALLLTMMVVRPHLLTKTSPAMVTLLETPAPAARQLSRMGGGGGQHGAAPVSKGTPPKFAPAQVVPPKAPPVERAKLEVPPTIDVQTNLKMVSALPNIGMVNAPTVGMSMGNGDGSGIGSGHGNGMGQGTGGNTGGGVKQVGGSVSAPVEIYKVEPEFSDEARRAKLSGNVLVNLWVDQSGRATHVRVLQGLGMGLDEKAIDAVRQFRFKPAMENGKPVTVELNIEVGFHIY